MSRDFRNLRRQRQEQEAPSQGIIVPENVYGVTLPSRETAEPLSSETVSPSNSTSDMAADQVVKTSFYPRQDQLEKLDELAHDYNKKYKRQRKRIDRQDIIRYLIDQCDLDLLTDLYV